jgi:hypothetical protein
MREGNQSASERSDAGTSIFPKAVGIVEQRFGPREIQDYSSSRRRRSAFRITENELNVIAALAIMGLRSSPNHG